MRKTSLIIPRNDLLKEDNLSFMRVFAFTTAAILALAIALAAAPPRPATPPTTIPAPEPVDAEVLEVKGLAQFRSQPQDLWQSVKPGLRLQDGTAVRLGVRSALKLRSADKMITIDRLGASTITRDLFKNPSPEDDQHSAQKNGTAIIWGKSDHLWSLPADQATPLKPAEGTQFLPAHQPGDTYTQQIKTPYADHLEFTMTYIPAGVFTMGSPENEPDRRPSEGPQHKVKINAFWMARTEVTAALLETWIAEVGSVRSSRTSALENRAIQAAKAAPTDPPFEPLTSDVEKADPSIYPGTTITAYGAQQFCRWLTIRTGRYYRLPTEAEWEYACRAGTISTYFFGDDPKKLGDYAWFNEDTVHPVAQKKPNPWGLYDMYGNLGEYVLDDWSNDFRQFTAELTADPWRKHVDPHYAIVRGGDFRGGPKELRSAARDKLEQVKELSFLSTTFNATGGDRKRNHSTGFRIVSPIEPDQDERAKTIPEPHSYWDYKK